MYRRLSGGRGKETKKSKLYIIPRGFPRAGGAASRDFPRAKPEGNPEEQPCQPDLAALGNMHSQECNTIKVKLQ